MITWYLWKAFAPKLLNAGIDEVWWGYQIPYIYFADFGNLNEASLIFGSFFFWDKGFGGFGRVFGTVVDCFELLIEGTFDEDVEGFFVVWVDFVFWLLLGFDWVEDFVDWVEGFDVAFLVSFGFWLLLEGEICLWGKIGWGFLVWEEVWEEVVDDDVLFFSLVFWLTVAKGSVTIEFNTD